MLPIDNEFEKDLAKEEKKQKERTAIGKLRKLKEGKTEVRLNDIAEIREVVYKFTDAVTRQMKPVIRKIYIFKNEFKSGVPLILPLSVHRDIRDLRLKHGEKMVKAIINAKGEGIGRRYKVVAEILE